MAEVRKPDGQDKVISVPFVFQLKNRPIFYAYLLAGG